MITTLEIVEILWARIQASALITDPVKKITGANCYHRRDPNSTKEDIVTNCLPINNEQLSKVIANVNIHVPDLEVTINGVQDKQPNHDRLKELAEMAVAALTDVWINGMNYTVQQQQLFRDTEAGDHYINIRVEFFIENL
jgi:hypothetical protein